MIDYILKFIKMQTCTHPNVETTKMISYCPDCGKLIHINWYIVRCRCCGKKRIGIIRNNKVIPIAKFCTNCGSDKYDIERINSLNYFDMNFAVAKKEEEVLQPHQDLTQSWVEEQEILQNLRCLSQYLN